MLGSGIFGLIFRITHCRTIDGRDFTACIFTRKAFLLFFSKGNFVILKTCKFTLQNCINCGEIKGMSDKQPEKTRLQMLLERLERRAKRRGLSVRQWLANADIQESSYYRWKKGENSHGWQLLID